MGLKEQLPFISHKNQSPITLIFGVRIINSKEKSKKIKNNNSGKIDVIS